MRHLHSISLVSSKLNEPSIFIFYLSIILSFPTLMILQFENENTFAFWGQGKMSTVSKRNVLLVPLQLTHWPLARAACRHIRKYAFLVWMPLGISHVTISSVHAISNSCLVKWYSPISRSGKTVGSHFMLFSGELPCVGPAQTGMQCLPICLPHWFT